MSIQNGHQEIRNQLNNIKSTLNTGNVIGKEAVDKVKQIIANIQKKANDRCEQTQRSSAEDRGRMMREHSVLQKETKDKTEELAAAKQELETSQKQLATEVRKALEAAESQQTDKEKATSLEESVTKLKEQIDGLNAEIAGRTRAIEELEIAYQQERLQLVNASKILEDENKKIHEMYKQLFSDSLGEIQQQLEGMTFERSGINTSGMSGGFQSSSSGVTDFKKYRSSSRSYSSRIKNLRKKRKESKKNRKKRKDKKKSETKKIYIEDKRRR
jgi:hypothetical protein